MSIKLYNENMQKVPVKFWKFPAGERGLKIGSLDFLEADELLTIECNFRSSDDLIDLLMLVNAIRSTCWDLKRI